MKCSKIRKNLSALVDGELKGATEQAVKAHLAECASCREILSQYGEISAAMAALPKAKPATDFEYSVISKLPQKTAPARIPVLRLAFGAALFAAALFFIGRGLIPQHKLSRTDFIPSGLVISDDEITSVENEAINILYGESYGI